MGGNLDIESGEGVQLFRALQIPYLFLFAFCLYHALVMYILSTMHSKATTYCQEFFQILLDKI